MITKFTKANLRMTWVCPHNSVNYQMTRQFATNEQRLVRQAFYLRCNDGNALRRTEGLSLIQISKSKGGDKRRRAEYSLVSQRAERQQKREAGKTNPSGTEHLSNIIVKTQELQTQKNSPQLPNQRDQEARIDEREREHEGKGQKPPFVESTKSAR